MNIDEPSVIQRPRKPVKKVKKRIAAAQQVVHAEAPTVRKSPRPAPPRAEGVRDIAREPVRRNARMAVGRDGEQLMRRRPSVGDKFDIKKSEWPPGWDYQWNAVTILNRGMNEIVQGDLQMHANGFRPVPASRFPGRWTPQGYEGDIIVEGQRLEERPSSMGDDARAEDIDRAKAQVRDRTDALKMTQKQLPGANVARDRNVAGGMRMSIDQASDVPRPVHEMIDDDFGE